tara:strand:+ start:7570 stop:8367 length:798 start_codon:yes stop_codon:yes gene_type:complete
MSLNKFTSFDRGQPVNMLVNANQLKLHDTTKYPIGTFLKVGTGGVIEGVESPRSERSMYEATQNVSLPLTVSGTYISMLPAFGFDGSTSFTPSSMENGDRIEFKCQGIYTTTASPSPPVSVAAADFKLILSPSDESIVYNNLFTAITDNKGVLFTSSQASLRRMFEITVILHKRINNGGAALNFQVVTQVHTSSWYGITQSASTSYPGSLTSFEAESITIPYSASSVFRFEPQIAASASGPTTNPDFTVFPQRSTIRQYYGGGYA